jgi:hypothetical protein
MFRMFADVQSGASVIAEKLWATCCGQRSTFPSEPALNPASQEYVDLAINRTNISAFLLSAQILIHDPLDQDHAWRFHSCIRRRTPTCGERCNLLCRAVNVRGSQVILHFQYRITSSESSFFECKTAIVSVRLLQVGATITPREACPHQLHQMLCINISILCPRYIKVERHCLGWWTTSFG